MNAFFCQGKSHIVKIDIEQVNIPGQLLTIEHIGLGNGFGNGQGGLFGVLMYRSGTENLDKPLSGISATTKAH